MVAEYNKWAEGEGFSRTKAHALQLDLLAEPQPTDPELSDFDVAAVCMALHHVADPPGLLCRLSKTLRPGGVCVVFDRVFQDERPELRADLPEEAKKVLQTINKHGFTEDDMRQYLQGAGMGKNFEYVVIERPFKVTLYGHDMELKGFIARGEVA
jgi:SAM-dependent methyltransferase